MPSIDQPRPTARRHGPARPPLAGDDVEPAALGRRAVGSVADRPRPRRALRPVRARRRPAGRGRTRRLGLRPARQRRLGRSARPRRPLVAAPRRPRRRLAAVRAQRPGRPVVLYGHSMGGLIVAGYLLTDRPEAGPARAHRRPASTRRCPAGRRRWRRSLGRVVPDAGDPQRHRRRDAVARPGGRREGRRGPAASREHGAVRRRGVRGAGARPRAGAGGLGIPTLVLHGLDDGLVPVGASEALEARPTSTGGRTPASATSSTTSRRAREIIDEVIAWLLGRPVASGRLRCRLSRQPNTASGERLAR